MKPPIGYYVEREGPFWRVSTLGFSGPKHTVCKLVWGSGGWRLEEFRGRPVAGAHRAVLAPWAAGLAPQLDAHDP